jgi:hypothetical protein
LLSSGQEAIKEFDTCSRQEKMRADGTEKDQNRSNKKRTRKSRN